MPSIKNLENRTDLSCENILTRNLTMESYEQDAHAVNINGLLSLAQNLDNVDVNQYILLCDNTERTVGELTKLLKDEERGRNLEIKLNDCEKAMNKKIETKKRITAQRRDKKIAVPIK